jgi:ubiquitin-protein ligase
MAIFSDTPRTRRLKADFEGLRALKDHSSILDFQAFGDPPERYLVTLRGKGLIRKSENDPVETAEVHRVEIRLGIDYPRSRPDLQWLTNIYHPNISAVGAVCLGGYSTSWVPSLQLAELCEMLWDMVRYANYDPKSAYNYAAGRWSEAQAEFQMPIDKRALRDRMARTVGDNIIRFTEPGKGPPPKEAPPIQKPPEEDVLIIDDNTVPPPAAAPPRAAYRPPPRPQPARPPEDDIVIIE